MPHSHPAALHPALTPAAIRPDPVPTSHQFIGLDGTVWRFDALGTLLAHAAGYGAIYTVDMRSSIYTVDMRSSEWFTLRAQRRGQLS